MPGKSPKAKTKKKASKKQAKKGLASQLLLMSKGGRPPKYDSADALIERATEYFTLCNMAFALPEKAGLCIALGISRDTYSEYRKKFPDAIRAFDFYIESNWVRRLGGANATGAIFYLKNAFRDQYKDRQELTGEDGGPVVVKHVEVTFRKAPHRS